ncbi:MAG: hypothetical protein RJA10_1797, partial [Pseudomonadota bacterium]
MTSPTRPCNWPSSPATRTLLTLGMALLGLVPVLAEAATLSLEIEPVASATGTLQVAVYDSEAGFRKKAVRAVKVAAVAGVTRLQIADLPPGEYAVILFHDLNGNDQLDSNLMGIPKEPWGGSIGSKSIFGPPSWNDARFTLPEAGLTVPIRL